MFMLFNFILSIILVPLFTLGWKSRQNRFGAFCVSVIGFTPFLGVPITWFLLKKILQEKQL